MVATLPARVVDQINDAAKERGETVSGWCRAELIAIVEDPGSDERIRAVLKAPTNWERRAAEDRFTDADWERLAKGGRAHSGRPRSHGCGDGDGAPRARTRPGPVGRPRLPAPRALAYPGENDLQGDHVDLEHLHAVGGEEGQSEVEMRRPGDGGRAPREGALVGLDVRGLGPALRHLTFVLGRRPPLRALFGFRGGRGYSIGLRDCGRSK